MIKRLRRLLVSVLTLAFVTTGLVTQAPESKSGAKERYDAQLANRPVVVGTRASFATQGPAVKTKDAWRRAQHERLPPFMVWTSLRLRDFESCLPAEATARPVGRQGYVVSNLTDYLAFAIRLSIISGRLRNEVPRFSRVGERDPGPPDASQKELFKKLAEIIVNLIYREPWPAGGEPFPEAALLDQEEVKRLLPNGWNPNGPVPQPFGPGFWIIMCDPKPPCVRPEEPTPETVPDCKAERDEVDRLLDKIRALENEIEQGNDLLAILEQIKAGKEAIDAAIAAMALMAGLTAPIALTPGTATAAIAAGPAGIAAGLAIVLPALAIYVATQLLDITLLNPLMNWIKGKIADLKRIMANYERGLKDALADLAACKKKAAEAKQRNTDAFQNYINVLLPAYYECLKKRKCRRVWIPK
ncbi:MAG: hypothetical protein ACT4OT_06400 [Acidobacteriota bacterium]